MTERTRADVLLCARGLASSRSRAQFLIRRGSVTANGRILSKPGESLETSVVLVVTEPARFVSRGGEKLDAALTTLAVNVEGAVVADIGASTGGFTDAVLQRGARKVYAIDVGTGQLDQSLLGDSRVESREGTNARDLVSSDFEEPIDVVVVDASFISLEKLLPALARIVRPGGALVALVKPQFEVGREMARRTRGVIRDGAVRAGAIEGVRAAVVAVGFAVLGECDSSLPGPAGNVEHFVYATRRERG